MASDHCWFALYRGSNVNVLNFFLIQIYYLCISIGLEAEYLGRQIWIPLYLGDMRNKLNFELDRLWFDVPDHESLVDCCLSKKILLGRFPLNRCNVSICEIKQF